MKNQKIKQLAEKHVEAMRITRINDFKKLTKNEWINWVYDSLEFIESEEKLKSPT